MARALRANISAHACHDFLGKPRTVWCIEFGQTLSQRSGWVKGLARETY